MCALQRCAQQIASGDVRQRCALLQAARHGDRSVPPKPSTTKPLHRSPRRQPLPPHRRDTNNRGRAPRNSAETALCAGSTPSREDPVVAVGIADDQERRVAGASSSRCPQLHGWVAGTRSLPVASRSLLAAGVDDVRGHGERRRIGWRVMCLRRDWGAGDAGHRAALWVDLDPHGASRPGTPSRVGVTSERRGRCGGGRSGFSAGRSGSGFDCRRSTRAGCSGSGLSRLWDASRMSSRRSLSVLLTE